LSLAEQERAGGADAVGNAELVQRIGRRPVHSDTVEQRAGQRGRCRSGAVERAVRPQDDPVDIPRTAHREHWGNGRRLGLPQRRSNETDCG
jgi:hypothetical protein